MEKMKYLLITWNDAWCNDDQLIPEEEPKTEPLETIDIGIVFKESEGGVLTLGVNSGKGLGNYGRT